MTVLRRLVIGFGSVALGAQVVVAQPQSPAQRQCIEAVARGTAALARAQGQVDQACARAASTGPLDPACLAGDPTGAVAAARTALATDAAAFCTTPPDFGVPFRLAEIAIAAAEVHARGLASDLFGLPDGSASGAITADRATARCRATIMRQADRRQRLRLRTALACQQAALAGGASDAAPLAACIAAPPTPAVQRATNRLQGKIQRACHGADAAAAAPGRCAARSADRGTCVEERVICRTCRMLNAAGALDADCETLDDGQANASCRMLVSLSGDILPFHLVPTGRLSGATVSILEHPERSMVTAADGHFAFDGLEEGSEVTLVMSHPDYHPIQNGTIKIGPAGAERVTFQAVINGIYSALAGLLGLTPDEEHACQMVTTFTRVGKSMYDFGAHGEAGATVTLSPALPAEHGPVYFNSSVLPDRSLSESSDDGGVLHVQVPPGEYVWTASKPGVAFSRIKMKCRPGFLVNASPPWGLQAQ